MATATAGRIGGDVSNKRDTAPALKDCKPLEVNEETRWKGKVLGATDEVPEDELKLKKALVVLNKLTLTNFDKMSAQFIQTGITDSPELVKSGVAVIVTKAQQESHFSEMYARLCQSMSSRVQNFKRVVVETCQNEFTSYDDIPGKVEGHMKEGGGSRRGSTGQT